MTQFVDYESAYRRLEADRAERIAAAHKMQCRVCWYVYDEAEGCPETQTPPGTPFKDLPGWWRCPQCDTPAERFIPLESADEYIGEDS